jgi:hypothetical protein
MKLNKDKRIAPLVVSILDNGTIYIEDSYGVHLYETVENGAGYVQGYMDRNRRLQKWWDGTVQEENSIDIGELQGYDWDEVFAIAGEDIGANYPDIRGALPTGDYDLSHFTRNDIDELYGYQDGENDERSWLVYGKLKDGRYFCIEASCDYTGWDCQSGGVATIANSKEELERFGLSEEARQRLFITLKP